VSLTTLLIRRGCLGELELVLRAQRFVNEVLEADPQRGSRVDI
jgi:hypothetical protein